MLDAAHNALAKACRVQVGQLQADRPLRQAGVDSLRLVEAVMLFEMETGRQVNAEHLGATLNSDSTVGDFVRELAAAVTPLQPG